MFLGRRVSHIQQKGPLFLYKGQLSDPLWPLCRAPHPFPHLSPEPERRAQIRTRPYEYLAASIGVAQIKRTQGNDWVYYSAGHYNDVFDLLGEYYLPCFKYPSNSIFREQPFLNPEVQKATAWQNTLAQLQKNYHAPSVAEEVKNFIELLLTCNEKELARRGHTLRSINKGRVTVLPPDSRHTDYEVIPLFVADGCLHNCGFCEIKTAVNFSPRTLPDIEEQLDSLAVFYGQDLPNYRSLFLAQHDALAVGPDILLAAAKMAYKKLRFAESWMQEALLFLFGSVESFLATKEETFKAINKLPYRTYINLNLESPDAKTIAWLRKPVAVYDLLEAFDRMVTLNIKFEKLEVTANFVLANDLPISHMQSLEKLLGERLPHSYDKGAIYLSPLPGLADRKPVLDSFRRLQRVSPLPVFLYLIQRFMTSAWHKDIVLPNLWIKTP